MRCDLTKPEDKLVALSGTAMEMQSILNDEYFAGLWRGYFIPGLLWYVDGWTFGPKSCRAQPYRAPSWSWASVDGYVDYALTSDFYGDFVDILDVQITPANSANALGQVISGFVKVLGQLIEIAAPEVFYGTGISISGCFYPDDEAEIVGETYYCLPLKISQVPGCSESLYGLVLELVSGYEYKRVGVFKIDEDERLEYLGRETPTSSVSRGVGLCFDQAINKQTLVIV